ncbi:MAG: glycine zipper family protein [Chloroflexi bacterium]|nr:glycine zipper family protein [Chloroflexota bacterium]
MLARRVVGTYSTYEDAQLAMDYLADRRFPVYHTAIVGQGLRLVEQVTGRRGYFQAIAHSVIVTAIAGALFGFFFGLFDWMSPLLSGLTLALYGLIFGAIVGAIIGIIIHAMSRGRRDFSSVPSVEADHYTIVADADVADQAASLLDGAHPVAVVHNPKKDRD